MNISEWSQQQTTIGHLKVRCTGVREDISKTALRLRVERLLSNADFHLRGLSTGAVLIVRKLDSPMSIGVSPLTQSVQANWHELLRNQITTLYATAARPMLGAVPPNTSCVFFTDPGEMLTCLTRDLLSGQVGERWYWQQVLRNVPRMPSAALPVLWCEQAMYVPTVLASLRPAEVFSVVTHLTPLAVKQIIHALHKSFDLPPEVLTAIASSELAGISRTHVVTDDQSVDSESIVSSLRRAGEIEERLIPYSRPAPTSYLPPWEQWLPGTLLPTLLPAVRYLLGLSLALYHASTFARSQRFAVQAVHWLQAEREKQLHMPDHARSLPEDSLLSHDSSLSQDSLRMSGDTSASKRHDRAVGAGSTQGTIPTAPTLSSTHLSVGPDIKAQKISSPEQDSANLQVDPLSKIAASKEESPLVHDGNSNSSSTAAALLSQEQSLPSPLASFQSVVPDASETKSAQNFVTGSSKALPTDAVSTRLGGVLYLINLLIWLNLPHSWDNDGTIVEHMSSWAIVEALARGLLSDLHERHVHDPIWHALTLLDGREPGTPIRINLRIGGSWRRQVSPKRSEKEEKS